MPHKPRTNQFLPECRRGGPPPCGAACPFGLDVRDFMRKMQRGSFDAAYRLYRETVVFPGIVSRLCGRYCLGPCGETLGGRAISLQRMERACMALARSLEPPALNLPAKEHRIAVVGAGLSGLSCALGLAAMKYDVTVYERDGAIGGGLRDFLPEEAYLPDIERQFLHAPYRLIAGREIADLSELKGEYDAVYAATGRGGNAFGLAAGRLPRDAGRGLIGGGGLTGAGPMAAIADGSRAAREIERFLKTGDFSHEDGAPLPVEKAGAALSAEDAEPFDKSRAMEEAARCKKCECDRCFAVCPLMKHYNKYPERVAAEVRETVNPGAFLAKSLAATRMIASCGDCGLCGQVCPEGIDLGEMMMRARQSMVEQGNLPPPFHAFHMREMEQASAGDAALALPAREGAPCRLLFFPGCQLGAAAPELLKRTYAYLRELDETAGLLLRCCGAPARWAGEAAAFAENLAFIRAQWERMGGPRLVVACPTCMRMLEEHLPELPRVSLYELLAESPPASFRGEGMDGAAVFDPCAARRFPRMRESVRELLRSRGVHFEELPASGPDALCCGWGGQFEVANPALAETVRGRAARLGDMPYITYCIVCRERFAAEGKPCRHILELAFPGAGDAAPPVSLSRKQGNRVRLRRELLREFWGLAEAEPPARAALSIPEALQERMQRDLILEADVLAVIEAAEESRRKLFREETGAYVAHLRIGPITYWAEYRAAAGGYELLSAYAHRMSLEN